MNNKEVFWGDITQISYADYIPWDKLKNKTILITGATGLIGSTIIKTLVYTNYEKKLNLVILGLVRDKNKAVEKFQSFLNSGILKLVIGSVESLPHIIDEVHYIIHGASQTSSKEFLRHPVETIQTSVLGTMNLLKLAKLKKVLGFVYLSSMEVYGNPPKEHKITEGEIGAFNPTDLRNSYPISKIVSEIICNSYVKEYQVPVMSARLTQTFGPGVDYNDNRVFAYFARCLQENKNIILKTTGETERSYLHTFDAATAVLTILLKGTPGQVYNVANENTYCSIVEMAEILSNNAAIDVEYDIQENSINGYLDTIYMDLDTSLLKQLGWKVMGKGLVDMFNEVVLFWKEQYRV